MDVGCSRARRRTRAGFTLIEVLVVISIISIFVGVIGYGFMRGSASATVGQQAAQSIIVGLLTEARSQAILSGRDAGVLIQNDTSNLPERYLRFLVPVIRDPSDSTWVALNSGVMLPAGCVVVPNSAPSGSWVEPGANWIGLQSSALASAGGALAVESSTSQQWLLVRYTPRGTTTAGNIVVAGIAVQPPGSDTAFQFLNPDNVRGVAVTGYGQTRLINDASGF